MKFLQSIRWRLQLWHGLLLGLVLAGFGFTGWRLEWANRLRAVDQALDERISVVAGVLPHGPSGGEQPREGRRNPDRPPPRQDIQEDSPPQDGPPQDQPEMGERPAERKIVLSAHDSGFFDGTSGGAYYYTVWLPGERLLSRSDWAPAAVPLPGREAGPRGSRVRGTVRESYHFTPQGFCVLVGRDISEELAGMRRLGLLFAGAGGAVFLLGLAGGWWISMRALRPIGEISATASKIAHGDLAQRIPTAGAGSELRELAGVLNETFTRLQAAFARQAQFTADAAHELRTPVSVVLTETQTVLARERSAAEYRASLEACQRSAQRMRRLTENLLALARLDSGEAAASRDSCDLAEIVGGVVDMLRPLAAERQLSFDLGLQAVSCKGSAEQLGRAVTNLVTNAIHYNRSGGSVRVTLEARPGSAVLSVADTGQGIAPEDIPHVFERFYRADRARSNPSGRTGLGLAITKAIVEAHGGTIGVVSEPGAGSTFTVCLPLDPQGQDTGAAAPTGS